MNYIKSIIVLFLLLFTASTYASFLLLPMDAISQKDHLKAYGITFYSLQKGQKVKWLLNYKGGSFLLEDTQDFRNECTSSINR